MTEVTQEQVQELLPFLANDLRADVRCVAMQYFLGVSGTLQGREFLNEHPQCLPAIVRTMNDSQAAIAKDSFLALVNICTDEALAWKVLNLESHPQVVKDLITYVLQDSSEHADIACMVLSNLSRSERCSQKIVQEMISLKDSIGFDKVIEVFCKENYNKHANLHYLGPFLCNLTQIREARRYVLDRNRCVVQRLFPYTQYEASLVRRGGIVGTLRNCCFETEFHEWLFSEEVDILPHLLLPLAGPEELDEDDMEKLPVDLQYLEPDKKRESDPDIRKMLVECVFQLCTTKPCREKIKECNTYVIMREYHKTETDPAADVSVENLIQLLLADEPTDPDMENLRNVQIPEKLAAQLDKAHKEQEEEVEKETRKLEEETKGDKEK